ncbi:hypothetical protein AB0N87_28600 [Streptomyces sp. NPDC093228]|uniref:TolB family protein n=1 Tax=Streptomyces sp. NPDC093228 TaxID=3155070 RepID=UPI0034263554
MSSEADGTELTTYSYYATVSDDGRYVAYQTNGPREGCPLTVSHCVFLKDVKTGRQVQIPGKGRITGNARISPDGRRVAVSMGDNLRPYVWDRMTGELQMLWPGSAPSDLDWKEEGVVNAISADGDHVTYTSTTAAQVNRG